MNDVLVIGGGAWGTALAIQAQRAGGSVALWLRNPDRATALAATRCNPRLPSAVLPAAIGILSGDMPLAGLRILAVPAQALREAAVHLSGRAPVLACAKGIEASTGLLPLHVLLQACPHIPAMVLSGPNFAHEVAAGLPAAAVLAGADATLRHAAAERLHTPGFRLYGNDDAIGVQIGGAAKNVVAIAAGAVIGAGLGENARAALVTRGLAEISRLALALGGRAETVAGLSGLGDLLLTCTGPASRNYSLGAALGAGATLDAALAAVRGTAEGVATAPALLARARDLDLELPICAAVADLIAGRIGVRQAIGELLARPRRDE